MSDLERICTRRAALYAELATLDLELAKALEALDRPKEADAVLSLSEAAAFMGEPAATFRRRSEYGKALVSRPTERRRRYSRAELDRIKADRLESSRAGA